MKGELSRRLDNLFLENNCWVEAFIMNKKIQTNSNFVFLECLMTENSLKENEDPTKIEKNYFKVYLRKSNPIISELENGVYIKINCTNQFLSNFNEISSFHSPNFIFCDFELKICENVSSLHSFDGLSILFNQFFSQSHSSLSFPFHKDQYLESLSLSFSSLNLQSSEKTENQDSSLIFCNQITSFTTC